MKDLNKIFSQGILVDLNIRYWTGQYKLNQYDLGFSGEVPEELITLGRKNLIPKDIRALPRKIESKAWYRVEQVSFPFPIGSAKFVPEPAIPELIEFLTACQNEYRDITNYIVGHYLSIRRATLNQFRKKMPEIYKVTVGNNGGNYKEFTEKFMNAVEQLYPDKSTIRSRYSFEWSFFEVSLPNYRKRSDRFLAKRAEENERLTREYRNRAKKEINEFLHEVVGSLRAQTVDVCSFVVNKIKRGEVISERNINNLRKFIERFETLNFVGDTAIHQQLTDLRNNYLHDIKYKNNQTATKQLQKKLSEVMDAAKDLTDVSSVTGQWKRRIRI